VIAHAVSVTCPAIGVATGCNDIINIGPGGFLTFTNGPAIGNPYDGSDDNLIGVQNNSGSTISSLTLSGSGYDGGIFEFDGDGISLPPFNSPGNTTDTTGYGGLNSYFTNITNGFSTGTVNFIGGLKNGGTLFFSLETAAQGGNGNITGVSSSVPEPETYAMLLVGLGLVGFVATRRKGQNGMINFA
jgi:hypothetical protein